MPVHRKNPRICSLLERKMRQVHDSGPGRWSVVPVAIAGQVKERDELAIRIVLELMEFNNLKQWIPG